MIRSVTQLLACVTLLCAMITGATKRDNSSQQSHIMHIVDENNHL